jgi:alpha-beta hydrolase superfamily lysophospholipase
MRLLPLFAALLLGACAPAAKTVSRAPGPPVAAPTRAVDRVEAPRARLPSEEVPLAFDRGLWHLEGVLTLPERAEGEKVPAVVIVHGSGPMSRDGVMHGQIGLGFGFALPVYKRLAEALSARGYAVYRYDKRTCGSFNGCTDHGPSAVPYSIVQEEFTTREYVGDAEAALSAIVVRPEIDRERTFFVGHSEGGGLIPVLLTARPEVRAGVMLAPPFNTMSVVLEQQSARVRWAFTAAGQPERAETEGQELLEAALALRRIEQGTHLGAPILGQPPDLWASWIELSLVAPGLARKLDRPLLVLGGSYDYNIVPSEIERWDRWLSESPGAPHRVRVLDCVTHALNCITQRDPTRITDGDIGRDVAPELIREIVAFLDARASSGRPRWAVPDGTLGRLGQPQRPPSTSSRTPSASGTRMAAE